MQSDVFSDISHCSSHYPMGGSSGNSIYVGSDHTHLLIDVGVSTKKVVAALHSM